MGRLTLHSKHRANNLMTLTYNSCFAPVIHGFFTTILLKTWDLSPKPCCGGDSMPNRTPTKTSWLTLESLCWRGNLCAESLQLVPNGLNVDNALSCSLLEPAAFLLLNQPWLNHVLTLVPTSVICVYSPAPLSNSSGCEDCALAD